MEDKFHSLKSFLFVFAVFFLSFFNSKRGQNHLFLISFFTFLTKKKKMLLKTSKNCRSLLLLLSKSTISANAGAVATSGSTNFSKMNRYHHQANDNFSSTILIPHLVSLTNERFFFTNNSMYNNKSTMNISTEELKSLLIEIPKKTTSYTLFLQDQMKLMPEGIQSKELFIRIADLWKSMSDAEKEEYRKLSVDTNKKNAAYFDSLSTEQLEALKKFKKVFDI